VGLRIFIDVSDDEGNLLTRSYYEEGDGVGSVMKKGIYVSEVNIPRNILGPINYKLYIQAGIHTVRYCIPPNSISIPINAASLGILHQFARESFRGKIRILTGWKTHEK
jgi:hypothetical protein